jgi:hypothetical protein
MAIFGEIYKRSLFRDAPKERLPEPWYPFRGETSVMPTEYHYFQAFEELPGEGAVFLECIKI